MIDISEKELSSKTQKWIALICGIIAVIFGNFFSEAVTTTELLFNPVWFLPKAPRFLLPNLIHFLISIAMLTPLYIRQILKYRNISLISILFLISNLYLFATWVQVAMGFTGSFTNIIISMGLIIAIILSWVGMRSIAGFSWIILIILCAYNIINNAERLAHWGGLFLIFSIISIWIQTKMPLDEFFSVFKNEFMLNENSEFRQSVKEDIKSSTSNI